MYVFSTNIKGVEAQRTVTTAEQSVLTVGTGCVCVCSKDTFLIMYFLCTQNVYTFEIQIFSKKIICILYIYITSGTTFASKIFDAIDDV